MGNSINSNVGGRDEDDYNVVPIVYWDPIRGLTVAQIEERRNNGVSQIMYLENAERLFNPLMTLPPETIVVSSGDSGQGPVILGKVTMPLGEIPKPLFKTILMNVIHGLARLRWEAPWRGQTYHLYKLASSSSGYIKLEDIVASKEDSGGNKATDLLKYLSRIWSLIICNSIIIKINPETGSYMETIKLSDAIKGGNENEDCFNLISQSFYKNPESSEYGRIFGDKNKYRLAINMAILRDLFLISIMLGKVNYIYKNNSDHINVMVISKQSRLEQLSRVSDPCIEEPDAEAFNLLFGDPTSLAIIPLIASISRVYGGKLWPRIPRLYLPYIYTRDCERLNLIEVIERGTEHPKGTPVSMQLHGQPESGLFMEALDVYSNSFFFMPWERSAMLTIFTRYLARGFKRSNKGDIPSFSEDSLVIPIGRKEKEVYRAYVFKRRMLHLTVEDLDTIAARMIESRNVEIILPRIIKFIRSNIESIASKVTEVLINNYVKYIKEINKSNSEIKVQGFAYEVLNPIIDLSSDIKGLGRLVAIEPGRRRRLVKNLIDRLTDSEYTRILIYIVIEPNKKLLYNFIYNKINNNSNDKSVMDELVFISELSDIAKIIVSKNKALDDMIKDVILDMSVFEYELY